MTLVLRDVEVAGRRTDVVVDGDRVVAAAPGEGRGSRATVVDGAGGALLPGLHDHHIHLLAMAASLGSVAVDDGAEILTAASRGLEPGEWLRAVGHHDRPGTTLDRWALDAVVADRPVRVQHRSGAMWVLNSRALAAAGLLDGGDVPPGCEVLADGTPTGRLFRGDRWLADRVPPRPPDLAAAGRFLLRNGVTGVTDATPYTSASDYDTLAAGVERGDIPQRVVVTGAPDLDVTSVPPPLTAGPAKVLLADDRPPSLDDMIDAIGAARAAGRAVAVHCVTRVALVLTLAALDEVGSVPGDRIEHGAVVPPDLYEPLVRHGVAVVTQPNFVAERGDDYLAEVEPDDVSALWPCASLIAAGIPVAAGTDAPFGRPDPWALVRAAATRRTSSGAVVGPAERVAPERALAMLLTDLARPGGPPRRVEVGAPADLCLLDRPLTDALAAPSGSPVRAVVTGGRVYEV